MAHFPLIALALLGADLSTQLAQIEQRYNSTKTLKSDFEQTVSMAQGRKTTEKGVLYLRKPGQMRWEYAQPSGKLFISDGKKIYYASAAARRVEVSAVRETDDLRAPLAFLLGKLDFKRDFSRFETAAEGAATRIRAIPKSEKSLFEYVEFVASPAGELGVVRVQGKDGSRMEYRFSNEVRNGAVDPGLFRYVAPEGYEVVQIKGAP